MRSISDEWMNRAAFDRALKDGGNGYKPGIRSKQRKRNGNGNVYQPGCWTFRLGAEVRKISVWRPNSTRSVDKWLWLWESVPHRLPRPHAARRKADWKVDLL